MGEKGMVGHKRWSHRIGPFPFPPPPLARSQSNKLKLAALKRSENRREEKILSDGGFCGGRRRGEIIEMHFVMWPFASTIVPRPLFSLSFRLAFEIERKNQFTVDQAFFNNNHTVSFWFALSILQ